MTRRIDVQILTPFGAQSGMGNWRTAQRYAQMLRASGLNASIIEPKDLAEAELSSVGRPVAIVLNARRSAEAVTSFTDAGIPTLVVLTGTDLYGALKPEAVGTADYQRTEAALNKAAAILVLQSEAGAEVARRWPHLKEKLHCIMQTALPRPQQAPVITDQSKTIRFLIAAHIRPEKDPVTAFHAFHQAFPEGWGERPGGKRVPVRLIHVGGHQDRGLADELIRLGAQYTGVLLEGPLTHAATLRLMTGVHALVQPSVSEGGALVVPEAIAAGLPVLASNIPAHRGQLGADYPGFFPVGDASGLARLMARFVSDADFQASLYQRSRQLVSALASPANERAELVKLVRSIAQHS